MKIIRSAAWWLRKARSEPDVPISAGGAVQSEPRPPQTPELSLLLTVARILRARIPEMAIAYQSDDLTALNEALLPWERPAKVVPINCNTSSSGGGLSTAASPVAPEGGSTGAHPPKCQCDGCKAEWARVDEVLSNAVVPPAPPETLN